MIQEMDNITPTKYKRFDHRRFIMFFRRYIGENGRRLLLAAIGMALVMIIVNLLELLAFSWQIITATSLPHDFGWSVSTDFFIFLFSFFATISGGLMFTSMDTRGKRLVEIEIPASQIEKYLTLLIIYLPCFIIVAFIAFYIGDAVRVIILKWFTSAGGDIEMIPPVRLLSFNGTGSWNKSDIIQAIGVYGTAISGQSLYALGSILFHRYSYLKTLCALFVIETAAVIIVWCSMMIFFPQGNTEFRFNDIDVPLTALIVASFFLVISVGLQWLAYARFKEAEYVSRW